MENVAPFGEILEAAGNLPLADQQALVEILNRRMIERRRAELAADIQEAQRDFYAGDCRPVSPAELLRDALS